MDAHPDGTGSTGPVDVIELVVDGRTVQVVDDDGSLLDTLRGQLGVRSAKDGCAPQGQCGCCTVLVDGQPRVACVTPTRRVAGRTVTTLDGLDADERDAWTAAMAACGASQCGFCTPGIVVRLAGLADRRPGAGPTELGRALAAHLCRCTGWQTIEEAWEVRRSGRPVAVDRDLVAAAERAALEGGTPQTVGPSVAAGDGGFAADTAPDGALVAVPGPAGEWVVADSVVAARAAAAKVQGRRSTVPAGPPLEVPEGDWDATLATSWVEPAYVETDAAWAAPDGTSAGPLANGGAFGGKTSSPLVDAARHLAARHGRPVLVLWSREDATRLGPKRPPFAGGLRVDGTGRVRVVASPGVADAVRRTAPLVEVEEVTVVGPRVSGALRAAGWAETAALVAAVGAPSPTVEVEGPAVRVAGPAGGWARVEVTGSGIEVVVDAGTPLDEVVLRSYCIGAVHMALSWVTSESLAVSAEGEVLDLTVRSFGVLRAADMVPVNVELVGDGPPVRGSDAVFAAAAAAVWRSQGCPPSWPTGTLLRLPDHAPSSGAGGSP